MMLSSMLQELREGEVLSFRPSTLQRSGYPTMLRVRVVSESQDRTVEVRVLLLPPQPELAEIRLAEVVEKMLAKVREP